MSIVYANIFQGCSPTIPFILKQISLRPNKIPKCNKKAKRHKMRSNHVYLELDNFLIPYKHAFNHLYDFFNSLLLFSSNFPKFYKRNEEKTLTIANASSFLPPKPLVQAEQQDRKNCNKRIRKMVKEMTIKNEPLPTAAVSVPPAKKQRRERNGAEQRRETTSCIEVPVVK
ncbi:hypothetical protein M9H77_09464 [Catharanthus roseus]|uniref:Uncharacterized protein n=1 Tax=Catharanthus roseus TaxID=4058 RepID=A0ACC0C0P2_CATRO|nr:hypothetical protein M9H77_09464 [Catharanthus roseus]